MNAISVWEPSVVSPVRSIGELCRCQPPSETSATMRATDRHRLCTIARHHACALATRRTREAVSVYELCKHLLEHELAVDIRALTAANAKGTVYNENQLLNVPLYKAQHPCDNHALPHVFSLLTTCLEHDMSRLPVVLVATIPNIEALARTYENPAHVGTHCTHEMHRAGSVEPEPLAVECMSLRTACFNYVAVARCLPATATTADVVVPLQQLLHSIHAMQLCALAEEDTPTVSPWSFVWFIFRDSHVRCT